MRETYLSPPVHVKRIIVITKRRRARYWPDGLTQPDTVKTVFHSGLPTSPAALPCRTTGIRALVSNLTMHSGSEAAVARTATRKSCASNVVGKIQATREAHLETVDRSEPQHRLGGVSLTKRNWLAEPASEARVLPPQQYANMQYR